MATSKRYIAKEKNEDSEGSETYEESKYEDRTWVKKNFKDEYDLFRYFFKHAKKTRYILQMIQEASSVVATCELYQVVDEFENVRNPDMSKVPKFNCKNESLLYADRCVDLKYNRKLGSRFMKANKTIPPRTVIVSEKPVLLYCPPNCKCLNRPSHCCHYCNKIILLFLPCEECEMCVYCDYKCRKAAWAAFHRWECDGFRRHYWKDADQSYLAFRLLLTGTPSKFGKEDCDGDEDMTKYRLIRQLTANLKTQSTIELNRILHDAARTVVYLIEKTEFFRFIFTKNFFPGKTLYECYIEIGGLLVNHQCQIMHNVMHLSQYNVLSTELCDPILYEISSICLTASLFNHSCEANAVVIPVRDHVVVKATRKIKRGEEITVNYSDECNVVVKFNILACPFICSCRLCSFDYDKSELLFAYKCRRCNGKVIRSTYICLKCNTFADPNELVTVEMRAIVYKNNFNETNVPTNLDSMGNLYNVVYHPTNIRIANLHFDMATFWAKDDFPKAHRSMEISIKIYENHYHKWSVLLLYKKLVFGNLVIQCLINGSKICSPNELLLGLKFLKDLKTHTKFFNLENKVIVLEKEIRKLKKQLANCPKRKLD